MEFKCCARSSALDDITKGVSIVRKKNKIIFLTKLSNDPWMNVIVKKLLEFGLTSHARVQKTLQPLTQDQLDGTHIEIEARMGTMVNNHYQPVISQQQAQKILTSLESFEQLDSLDWFTMTDYLSTLPSNLNSNQNCTETLPMTMHRNKSNLLSQTSTNLPITTLRTRLQVHRVTPKTPDHVTMLKSIATEEELVRFIKLNLTLDYVSLGGNTQLSSPYEPITKIFVDQINKTKINNSTFSIKNQSLNFDHVFRLATNVEQQFVIGHTASLTNSTASSSTSTLTTTNLHPVKTQSNFTIENSVVSKLVDDDVDRASLIDKPVFVRRKLQKSFFFPSAVNVTDRYQFRFDLAQVWSGKTKQEAEQQQLLGSIAATYEFECECLDDQLYQTLSTSGSASSSVSSIQKALPWLAVVHKLVDILHPTDATQYDNANSLLKLNTTNITFV